jgi:type IV secretory pathway component VirB8
MSEEKKEQQQHHHHHHHHHKMDGASKFKRNSLLAIERQKKIAKYGLRAGYILAIIMVLAVIIAYTFL